MTMMLIMSTCKPEIIKRFYSVLAPFYDHLVPLLPNYYKIYQPLLLEGVEPCKLLDIGCGTGIFLKMAYKKGFDIYGIDFTEGMIKIAKSKFDTMNVDNPLVMSSITNLPFEDETFDLVVSSCMLSLIEDIDGAIIEIIRVCKTGGEIRLLEIGEPKKETILTKMNKRVLSFLGNVTRDYVIYFSKHGYSCNVVEFGPTVLTKLFKVTKKEFK